MPPGPKLIAGDLNGPLEAFPTLMTMLREEGWTDVGADQAKCGGNPCQPTCHTNASSSETRIDYILANELLSPAITACTADRLADYPTHRPIGIQIRTEQLQNTVNENVKPTDFTELFEGKVKEEWEAEEEELKNNEQDEEAAEDNDSRRKQKSANENRIRKRLLKQLHEEMDRQLEKREHRLRWAAHNKNTTSQWDLIAAAFEEANIVFHDLKKGRGGKSQGAVQGPVQKQNQGCTGGPGTRGEGGQWQSRLV
jgi:hypothetical protein